MISGGAAMTSDGEPRKSDGQKAAASKTNPMRAARPINMGISMGCPFSLWVHFAGEHGGVDAPVGPNEIKFEHKNHDTGSDGGGLESEMETNDVYNYRRNQGERQRDETVDQK